MRQSSRYGDGRDLSMRDFATRTAEQVRPNFQTFLETSSEWICKESRIGRQRTEPTKQLESMEKMCCSMPPKKKEGSYRVQKANVPRMGIILNRVHAAEFRKISSFETTDNYLGTSPAKILPTVNLQRSGRCVSIELRIGALLRALSIP